jgi:hypothetical protein
VGTADRVDPGRGKADVAEFALGHHQHPNDVLDRRVGTERFVAMDGNGPVSFARYADDLDVAGPCRVAPSETVSVQTDLIRCCVPDPARSG